MVRARSRSPWIVAGLSLTAWLLGCSAGEEVRPRGGRLPRASPISEAEATEGPFVRVLGTVQDGGFPHAACSCTRCTAARKDPALQRKVASLALCFPSAPRVYLVDATPDIRQQLKAVGDVRSAPEGRVNRAPVDGIFLTHAHMGHYLGLGFFGFEAVNTTGLPVYCTPRMGEFLRNNGPWDQLVRLGNIQIRESLLAEPVTLDKGVTITALPVPHRDEYTDTVGFLIRGARSKLLYVPDTGTWQSWNPALPEIIKDVDIAILDGTFYSMDELPGRPVSSIGHPLITQSMDLLESEVHSGRLRVFFTHLNHSNPALEVDSRARRETEERGFRILEEGQTFPL